MLIHADGFGLYGTGATGRTNMLAGVYAEVQASCTPETTNPRGVGSHHLRIQAISDCRIRRVLGADYGDGIGFGAAFYFLNLPVTNGRLALFGARDNANDPQFTVTLETTGVVSVRRGDHSGPVVVDSVTPVMVASAYQHFELFAVVGNAGASPAGGAIEIRINGVTVINASGIDLQDNATNDVSQYIVGYPSTQAGSEIHVADLHTWDTSTAVNNDFLGDVQWLARFPTADEAAQGWTPNITGSGFAMIDEVGPDGDTTYIEATVGSPDTISEFALGNIPANVSDVVAVITQPMLRKTDAGAGSVQMTMLSSDIGSPPAPAESDGTVKALTTAYTYYIDVHPTDPATGIRWSRTGYDNATLRLTRTA